MSRRFDTPDGQLVNRLNLVTKVCIPKSKFKPHLKPPWTKELSKAHKLMKYLRYVWLQNGRPRESDKTSYKENKHAKCEFRKLHSKAVAIYLKELDEQINAAAEIDSKQFWRLIKSKRSNSATSMSAEIKFDGVTYKDPQEINNSGIIILRTCMHLTRMSHLMIMLKYKLKMNSMKSSNIFRLNTMQLKLIDT